MNIRAMLSIMENFQRSLAPPYIKYNCVVLIFVSTLFINYLCFKIIKAKQNFLISSQKAKFIDVPAGWWIWRKLGGRQIFKMYVAVPDIGFFLGKGGGGCVNSQSGCKKKIVWPIFLNDCMLTNDCRVTARFTYKRRLGCLCTYKCSLKSVSFILM